MSDRPTARTYPMLPTGTTDPAPSGAHSKQQNRLRRLSEYYVYDDASRIRTLVSEHCQIMDVLIAGDRAWAASLLRRHLEIASRLSPPFGDAAAENARS